MAGQNHLASAPGKGSAQFPQNSFDAADPEIDEERDRRRKEFTSGEPGFGISACEYFADRKVILTGGDTSANDAQPMGEQPDLALPCHTEMQTRRGTWNLENLEFTQLLKDKAYEFLFVWAPLRIVGGTGSPGNPVALY